MRKLIRRQIIAVICLINISIIGTTVATAVTNPSGKYRGSSTAWVVSLWSDADKEGNYLGDGIYRAYCTGTLIDKRLVLTAAHCVVGVAGNKLVLHGAKSLFEVKSLIYVEKSITHPKYNPKSLVNDIALLYLESDAPAPYLELVGSDDRNATAKNKVMWLLGWGENSKGENTGKLGVTRQYNQTNSAKRYYSDFDQRLMIGAGAYDVKKKTWSGSCFGDSGGPLVSDGKAQLLGVVSFGGKRCSTAAPSIYTRVSAYLEWIVLVKTALELDSNQPKELPNKSEKPNPSPSPTPTPIASTIPGNEFNSIKIVRVRGSLEQISVEFTPLSEKIEHKISCGSDEAPSLEVITKAGVKRADLQAVGLRSYNCVVTELKAKGLSSEAVAVYVPISYSNSDKFADAPTTVDITRVTMSFFEKTAVLLIQGPSEAGSVEIEVLDTVSLTKYIVGATTVTGSGTGSVFRSNVGENLQGCNKMKLSAGVFGDYLLTIPITCLRFPNTAEIVITVRESKRGEIIYDRAELNDNGERVIRTYP